TVPVSCNDVDGAISNDDRCICHEILRSERGNLIPFVNADLAPTHKTEERADAEHCEDALREIDPFGCADAQRHSRLVQDLEGLHIPGYSSFSEYPISPYRSRNCATMAFSSL